MRKPVIVYTNCNMDERYEDAKNYLIDDGNENPTEAEIWDEINFEMDIEWEEAKSEMDEFFADEKWVIYGLIERWDGIYTVGLVFSDFNAVLQKLGRDCDKMEIIDDNGQFLLNCGHHDGNNHFEIRKLTKDGIKLYEDWQDNPRDVRREKEIIQILMKDYSMFPHFMNKKNKKTKKKSA